MEKNRRKKMVVFGILVVIVLLSTVAFATMSIVLNINGTAKLNSMKWDIYFDNLSVANTFGSASEISVPSIVDKTTIDNIEVALNSPKDMVTYNVDLVNEGNIDAEIEDVLMPKLSKNQSKYLEIKLLYEDGSEVKKGDILQRTTLKKVTLKIKYKDDLGKEDLPSVSEVIDVSCTITFIQTDNKDIADNVTTIKQEEHANDPNPGDITNNGLYDGSKSNPYQIQSIEDLVQFSNDVSDGNSYANKYIIVANNLDFNESSSYVDSRTTAYGDINEDGKIDAIKQELTTDSGFKPIGNNSNYFKGTFDGNDNVISNLMINRASVNYVGLFGQTSGTVQNLTISNVNITGNNYVGGITGNWGKISDINVSGTIHGNDYVGGITGNGSTVKHSKVDSSNIVGNTNVGGVAGYDTRIYSTVVDANVTGTNCVGGALGSSGYDSAGVYAVVVSGDISGTKNVGGLSGFSNYSVDMVGIYKEGNVSGSSSVGLIYGGMYQKATRRSYSIKTATLNGSKVSDNKDFTLSNGQTIETINEVYKDINLAELVLDTYIGGDNDGDGYYYDYNEDKTKLVEKNISENPLVFSLEGSGTSANPYIINTKEDLKQINLKLDKVYKLNNDIDLTGEDKYYIIGSGKNPFTGTFDGNGHVISGLTINNQNVSYAGIFGYATGTIKNLTVSDENITGNNYVGGITGAGGKISDINVSGIIHGNDYVGGITGNGSTVKHSKVNSSNIVGNNNVGGVAGYDTRIYSTVVDANVTGTNCVGGALGSSGYDSADVYAVVVSGDISGTKNVGGLSGFSTYSVDMIGIYKKGNVSGSSSVGLIYGGVYEKATRRSYSIKTATLNGSKVSDNKDFTLSNGQTIETINEVYKDINLAELVLDTYIGGDNDGDGYYYDYNEDKTKLVEKNISENPLVFSLEGSGTSANPYIINTKEDLKQINLKLDKVYKLNNDIDLTGEDKYYIIGSGKNPFTGTFDGNGHVISGLTINNQNVSYAGIFGYATGTIKNLTVSDENITGNNYVGGVVGQGSAMTNISVSSDIIGNNYVGGIAGYAGNINQFVVSSNVTGSNYVGCASGGADSSKGVCLSGKIVGTSNVNRIFGTSKGTRNVLAIQNEVLVNNSKKTNTSSNSNDGLDILREDLTQQKYEELGFTFEIKISEPYWLYNDSNILLKGVN